MTRDKLFRIKDEIKRFEESVDDAIERFNSNEEYYDSRYCGVGNTKESGAVRRRFVDFKYEVNKILNG